LKGLDASVVKYAEVVTRTSTKRFDAEYYQLKHIHDDATIERQKNNFQSFAELGVRVDASAFYPSIEEHYGEGDLPFLRVSDVDEVIDFQACETIPEHLCEIYPTLSKVKEGDLVFTKGGSVARIGYVTNEAAVSRDLIFVNSSTLRRTLSKYIYTYSRTDFFRRMLVRSSSQTAQPHLTITLVRELPNFIASQKFEELVANTVDAAFVARQTAIELNIEANGNLLRALGLASWKPPEPLSYLSSSADAFAAGRLDAQFFAPRIRGLINHLSRSGSTVGGVSELRRQKFNKELCDTFDYIEIGDLSSAGMTGSTPLPCDEAPSRATWHVRPGDVITSMVRPIRRLSAQILPEQDSFVCSSGFVVLQPTQVPSEVLLTYLRLPVICELMDLYASASMYPAISEADILALPFPRIDKATAEAICLSVQQSREASQRATLLLDAAKRAVEIAIEDNEAAALRYLEEAGA
jgi:type I restriction enzyme, S subunit